MGQIGNIFLTIEIMHPLSLGRPYALGPLYRSYLFGKRGVDLRGVNRCNRENGKEFIAGVF